MSEFATLNGYIVKDATARANITDLQNKTTILENRMNAFSNLEEGSTTGDAELIDARVDYKGNTWENVGEHIRGVTSDFSLLPLPQNAFVGVEVNLNTLFTIGYFAIDESCTIIGAPADMIVKPLYVKVEKIYNPNSEHNGWIKQTVGRWDSNEEYFRVINGTTVFGWMNSTGIVSSTNDDTDRTTELQNILTRTKHLRLGAGVFYVNQLSVPVGAIIEGCGANTQIIHKGSQVTTIILNSKATIRNLSLIGSFTEQPNSTTEKTANEVGIAITGATENAIIDGCFIKGFTHSGIWLNEATTAVRSAMISNCDITYCNMGIYLLNSEYACVSNCVIRDNYIGVFNGGGNNKFSCCGFDSNGVGFLVTGTTNNGHGSAVACSFNHNEEYAITLQGVDYGYNFGSCQVHDGKVHITATTKGITFNGCSFGNGVVFNSSSANPELLVGCTFFNNPKEVEGYTDPNNKLSFINCLNYSTGEFIA